MISCICMMLEPLGSNPAASGQNLWRYIFFFLLQYMHLVKNIYLNFPAASNSVLCTKGPGDWNKLIFIERCVTLLAVFNTASGLSSGTARRAVLGSTLGEDAKQRP